MIKNTWVPHYIKELLPSALQLYETSVKAKKQLASPNAVIPEVLSIRVRNILFRYRTKTADHSTDKGFSDDLHPFIRENDRGSYELNPDSIRKAVEDGTIWNVPGLGGKSVAEICSWLESP